MLTHGAKVWCQNPTTKLANKLAKMQRGFLLAISGAYRTSPTAALQVVLGIAPLHLQFQMESHYVTLTRLRKPLPPDIINISPQQIESDIVGYRSKTEDGVGAVFCAYEGTEKVKAWSTKLQNHNTVYQAELTVANEAAKYASEQNNSATIVIHIDNQASIISSAIPRTPNAIAKNINNILLQHPNIQLTWIKAHVGYEGNEYADKLAKQDTESSDSIHTIDIPKCHIKSMLKESMLQWTDGTTGRIVHDVIPKVKQRLTPWKREDFIFFQAMALSDNSERDSGFSRHQTVPEECTAPLSTMSRSAP
ncbi:hypothetical protein AVEN_234814-1 [Araneus ventricosus]|uniref:ribonuclease H n=1 Tax=Araneus ventricosus TaxID=182803 RepID=A0A4Y2F4J5_ARAVE|nr:hypothetical protein AVEN_234814-1 [Araneus ventricosus]